MQEALEKVGADIRALDYVWTQVFSGASANEVVAVEGGFADDANPFNRKVVEIAVGSMEGIFSAREVEAEINRRFPHIALSKNNIGMKLKRMTEESPAKIEVVELGIGRRPSTYKRI